METPDVEITVQKVESLGRELSELKDLEEYLALLGDPLKRQDGESASDYLGRVDNILKGRAYYYSALLPSLSPVRLWGTPARCNSRSRRF